MTRETCCECGKEYFLDELFELRVCKHGWIYWCFRCAAKQIKLIDAPLAKKLANASIRRRSA